MQIIKGVSGIAKEYELFLVDLWGVMHDGVACYPEALDCLAQLKKRGKKILLLSNAPRRADHVVLRSEELGLRRDLYDFVFSSGEMTWLYLQEAPLGKRAYPIMTDKDMSLVENTPIELISGLASSDFILCSGPEEKRGSIADWVEILQEAQERGLPMLCANPDLVVHRGGKEEICAGTIAQSYEELGGKVMYFGKPYPAIYTHIIDMACGNGFQNWIAFGDSLRTDIQGAQGAEGASLLIAGGIHVKDLLPGLSYAKVEKLVNRYGCRPNFVLDYLCW